MIVHHYICDEQTLTVWVEQGIVTEFCIDADPPIKAGFEADWFHGFLTQSGWGLMSSTNL